MLLAMLLLAVPVSLELEVAGGFGQPFAAASHNGPTTPALQVRAGADFFEHLTISAALLGIVGGETGAPLCGGRCTGNASFRAMSGFATLRLHGAGDWQAFVEGGIGPGHLISVSADDLFENPAQHGRGGPAYLLVRRRRPCSSGIGPERQRDLAALLGGLVGRTLAPGPLGPRDQCGMPIGWGTGPEMSILPNCDSYLATFSCSA